MQKVAIPKRTSRRIDEEPDILGVILRIEKQQLAYDRVGEKVIDLVPQEHDPLSQQQPHHVRFRAPHGGRRRLRSER